MAGITYQIDFAAAIARLVDGTEQGAAAVGKMADRMEASSNFARNALASIAGAISVQTFAQMVLGANDAIAAYSRLGDVAGTTAESISKFDVPARLAETSLDSVASAVSKLGKSLGEARLGDVSKGTLFKALGIDVKDGRDAADVMLDVAKAVSGFADRAVAGKVASDLLGKAFAEIQPFLRELSEQGTLTARVTAEQAEQAKQFKQSLVLLTLQSEISSRQFTEGLVPSLQAIAKAILEVREGSAGLGEVGETAGTMLKMMASLGLAAVDVFYGLGHAIAQVAVTANLVAHGEFAAAVQAFKDADTDIEAHTIATNARIEKIWEESAAKIKKTKSGIAAGGDAGASKSAGPSAAEAAIKEQMDFQLHFQELISAEQGFAAKYSEAIKVSNVLAQEARKQGLLSDTHLIEQLAQNEDARLQVQIVALQKEEELYRRKGELAQAQQARDKIQIAEAQRIANDAIAKAQITSLQDARETAFQQNLAQRVAQIQLENVTELELLQGKFTERQNIIEMAAQAELITNDQYGALSAQNYAAFEKSKTDIARRENEARLNTIQNGLGQAAGLMQSHSRAMFEVGKAAAISQTIMDTYRGAQAAIAALAGIPFIGPALAVAAAAGIITAGLARAQQIRSTPFGGGGGGSGGATPTFNANPVTGVPTAPLGPISSPFAPTQGAAGPNAVEVNVTVINQGGVMIGDDGIKQLVLDQIVPVVTDAMNHDSLVLFNQNSRQAQNQLTN